MNSEFDEIIDRHNTFAIKTDLAVPRGKPADALPLWVADMDFRAPECIRRALIARAQHGIWGYSRPDSSYYDAVQWWFKERHGWSTERGWIINTPGVVFALATAVRAFSKEGDGVMIQQPVYYPFSSVIADNRRRIVSSPLAYDAASARYSIDFADFEKKIVLNGVRLFLLCSPHNPVGRVWTEAELRRMAEICLAHKVIIVADEIHCDFVWDGHRHIPLATLGAEIARHGIFCTAPSKTFNLAGLQISNIFIPNPVLRNAFQTEFDRSGYCEPGADGLVACRAGYSAEGAAWLAELQVYLKGNLDFLREYLRERLPKVRLVEPEGTYLAWLDFNGCGMNPSDLNDTIARKAKVWLDDGHMFGADGDGFQRINLCSPRSVIKEALDRIADAMA